MNVSSLQSVFGSGTFSAISRKMIREIAGGLRKCVLDSDVVQEDIGCALQ